MHACMVKTLSGAQCASLHAKAVVLIWMHLQSREDLLEWDHKHTQGLHGARQDAVHANAGHGWHRVVYMAAFASVIAAANGSWMGLALSLWGVVVALSRALLGRHYLGDVCAGAVVGLLNTAIITKVCPFCSQ